MRRLWMVSVVTGILLWSGSLGGAREPEDTTSQLSAGEVLRVLGDGVVGDPAPGRPLRDPVGIARWEAGEWWYRLTAGARRGKTELESLTPIGLTPRGETWKRTVGREYTLYVRQTADGDLVMPTEIAHAHGARVSFDPPLSYLLIGLEPGERRTFDGKMEVYSAEDPSVKRYSGRIRATTMHGGVYRVKTPAGTFDAILIRTDYKIDIFTVVTVTDRLYTFYAEGVGKVAEAEHRRTSMIGMFNSDTITGKVLVSFTSITPVTRFEAP
jgi:hypothetical protein